MRESANIEIPPGRRYGGTLPVWLCLLRRRHVRRFLIHVQQDSFAFGLPVTKLPTGKRLLYAGEFIRHKVVGATCLLTHEHVAPTI
jgi:hypothetical protein